jgi:hypothetical protein
VQHRQELLVLAILLGIANTGLFFGVPMIGWIFQPLEVVAGEWWRVVTWPLIHVSPYQLALDGLGFFGVYALLGPLTRGQRLALTACAAAGSLLVPLAMSQELHRVGLSGLSGPAHGLMAAATIVLWRTAAGDRLHRNIVAGAFCFLLAKCLWEAGTGSVAFSGLHFGNIGTPIVSCHLGGLSGGLLGMALLYVTFQYQKIRCRPTFVGNSLQQQKTTQIRVPPNLFEGSGFSVQEG